MSITQFNATYVAEEDRVLFRFNTSQSQEYRLWFTRSIVRQILALGEKASVVVLERTHPPEQAKAIAQFKQQVTAEQAQFTSFVPATHFPLGAEPVLIHQVRANVKEKITALEFVMPKGQVLTMNLTDEMVSQLRLLLETISQRVQWGLQVFASAPTEPTQTSQALPLIQDKVLH